MTDKNVVSNVDTLKNLTPFTKDRQPDPKLKRAGWERKRMAKEIMDKIEELSKLPVLEAKERLADIKEHPENYTQLEYMMLKYITKDKHLIDFLNRHVPYAPQKTEISGEDGGPITISQVLDSLDK